MLILAKKAKFLNEFDQLINLPLLPKVYTDNDGKLLCNLKSYHKDITIPFDEFISEYTFKLSNDGLMYYCDNSNEMFKLKGFDEFIMVVEIMNFKTKEVSIITMIDFFSNYSCPIFKFKLI